MNDIKFHVYRQSQILHQISETCVFNFQTISEDIDVPLLKILVHFCRKKNPEK